MRSLGVARVALSIIVVPGVIAAASASLWWLRSGGVDDVVAASLVWIGALVVLIVLERMIPYERAWLVPDGQLGADFGHAFLGSAVGARAGGLAVEALAAGVVIAMASAGVAPAGAQILATLPWLAQFVIVYLGIDLLRYGQHRAQHAIGWLWETHQLHHDARRLLALKAGRSHILDRMMQGLCAAPFVILGAPADVVFWCVAVNSLIGLVAHANVDVRLGLLGHVLVGPEQHRVHHARAPELHHANFGASLMVWDRLFGTAVDVDVRETGLPTSTPDGFVAQLAAPVRAWLE